MPQNSSIRIVTHCYAELLPQFASFLQYQLSSLLQHTPQATVRMHVFTTAADTKTIAIASAFEDLFLKTPTLGITVTLLEPGALFRRSIGRNLAALHSTEDVVWFTDVDHYFGEGCLDEAIRVWGDFEGIRPLLIYPRIIHIHENHEIGDAYARTASGPIGILSIQPTDFVEKTYQKAIGGVQIVQGSTARQFGYLNAHEKWQRPRTDGKPFRDFRDDVAFRQFLSLHGAIKRVDLPNLYRLRHTLTTY